MCWIFQIRNSVYVNWDQHFIPPTKILATPLFVDTTCIYCTEYHRLSYRLSCTDSVVLRVTFGLIGCILQLITWLSEISQQYASVCTLTKIGSSIENRHIYVIKVKCSFLCHEKVSIFITPDILHCDFRNCPKPKNVQSLVLIMLF